MAERALILLVDDSEDDILLIQRAFERAEMPGLLYSVRSGKDAVDYLLGEGKFADRAEHPLPGLMLLDLKMPEMDGFDVLRWVRSQPGLSRRRVVVLTSSDQIRDVNQAYQLGANSFMVKPMDFENYKELARTVQKYWVLESKTPEISRAPRQQANIGPQS